MAAQAAIPNTTLGAAITDTGATVITVASTTGILVNNILVCNSVAYKVLSVISATQLQVRQGVAGTTPKPQLNGARVFYGTGDLWQTVYDNALGVTGNPANLPQYLMPGARATDGRGNEYVMVDLTTTCYSGTTVLISNDGNYTATQLAGGQQGSVGLTLEEGTSNQWTWAQIYGYNAYAQETIADSAGTSALLALAATTPSTPSVGLAASAVSSVGRYYINGMFIVGAATTATTSASSATGVAYPVWLNYPYVVPAVQDLSSL